MICQKNFFCFLWCCLFQAANSRNTSIILYLIFIQADQFRHIFFQKIFMCFQRTGVSIGYKNFGFAKFLGYFLRNLNIGFFGIIQHCLGTSCIKKFFNIFHSFHIACTYYRHFTGNCYLFDRIKCKFMFFICIRLVKYNNSVSIIVAIVSSQPGSIVIYNCVILQISYSTPLI